MKSPSLAKQASALASDPWYGCACQMIGGASVKSECANPQNRQHPLSFVGIALVTTSNHIESPKPQKDDGEVSDAIRRTMVLATQALDGHELSDEEPEVLCEAMLEVVPGRTKA